jgi:membrane carboxypeptidase/penicillin-binding protein PbpC
MNKVVIRIVYPIEGESYPIVKSDSLVSSAHFTASFSITAAGGPHKIKWGFDGTPIGGATFFDQFSAQFTWELPAGEHNFHVLCCKGNRESVNFVIA